jgi:hypothetical protein
VGYIDDDMLVPEVVPLVFVGHDLEEGHPGAYFQDAASVHAGLKWRPDMPDDEGPSVDVRIEVFPPDTVASILAFEGALDALLGCSLRRTSQGG